MSRLERAHAAMGEPEAVVDLLPRRREAVRMMTLGFTNKEIAQELSYSQAWVSTLRRTPAVQAHLKRLQEARDTTTADLKSMIDGAAPRAVEVLMNVLDPGTPEGDTASIQTKVKVAQDLLDRQGDAVKVSRTQTLNRHEHLHVTAEDLEKLKRKQRRAPSVGG